MNEIEKISFQIISSVGSAKSSFMEAIQFANNGDFTKAEECIEEGENLRIKGHNAHFELIQQEASGDKVSVSLLLMHAEDQLMGAETIKIMAEELIKNYKRINHLEKKIGIND